MYSIVIAIIFFAVGGWLLKVEWAKAPNFRNVWSLLSAALSLTMGVAVTLVWLVINFL
jgi:hypothetical protein